WTGWRTAGLAWTMKAGRRRMPECRIIRISLLNRAGSCRIERAMAAWTGAPILSEMQRHRGHRACRRRQACGCAVRHGKLDLDTGSTAALRLDHETTAQAFDAFAHAIDAVAGHDVAAAPVIVDVQADAPIECL